MASSVDYDVIVAGCGIAGLLMAWDLSKKHKVLVIEDQPSLPKNKYWLTDIESYHKNPELAPCIDIEYDSMDFIAFDNFCSKVTGQYILWNTSKLLLFLLDKIQEQGATILYKHRLYSYGYNDNNIAIKCENKVIKCKLLIDCMGHKSPVASANAIYNVIGYYFMTGATYRLKKEVNPIALHNVTVDGSPSYLELFPTSEGMAHAALIYPARSFNRNRNLGAEFQYLVRRSEYSEVLISNDHDENNRLQGIIPVGRLRKVALDRIFFFGEAGQYNPATSATGLTSMLRTHAQVAAFLSARIESDELSSKALTESSIQAMSKANRYFQEALFERVLSFNSAEFKKLVMEMEAMDDIDANNFIFASYDFSNLHTSLMTLLKGGCNVRKAALRAFKIGLCSRRYPPKIK